MTRPHLVLVHSPIVGSQTWHPVRDALRAAGTTATVPVLPRGPAPHWQVQTSAVVQHVQKAGTREPIVLVAHSGAGQLMAQIGSALSDSHDVAAYLFVDAGLPTRGVSRLEQLRSDNASLAEELATMLDAGVPFPSWGDDVLRPLVTAPADRAELIRGLRPLPIHYWTERIPAVESWPEAPCGMLLTSRGYDRHADVAHRRGWEVRDLDQQNHFLLIENPSLVAEAILELLERVVGAPEV